MRSNNPYYPYHPGIQIASIPVRHSVGLLITIGVILICLVGLSFTIYYLIGAAAVGALFCWMMRQYRSSHPPKLPLRLDLD